MIGKKMKRNLNLTKGMVLLKKREGFLLSYRNLPLSGRVKLLVRKIVTVVIKIILSTSTKKNAVVNIYKRSITVRWACSCVAKL